MTHILKGLSVVCNTIEDEEVHWDGCISGMYFSASEDMDIEAGGSHMGRDCHFDSDSTLVASETLPNRSPQGSSCSRGGEDLVVSM